MNTEQEAGEWPAGLEACAQAFGATLPKLGTAAGLAVTWSTPEFPALGSTKTSSSVVADDDTATLDFITGRESQDDHDHGQEETGYAPIDVTIERNEIQNLADLVTGLVSGQLPGAAGTAVQSILTTLTQPLVDAISTLIDADGHGVVPIVHHGPAPPKDAGSCPAPVAGAPKVIADGSYTGPIDWDINSSSPNQAGALHTTGSGTLSLVVKGGVVTGGSWSGASDSSGEVYNAHVKATLNAVHMALTNGTVSGPATGPLLAATATLTGTITADSYGQTADVPLNGVQPASGTMLLLDVSCTSVVGTFTPGFNASAAGKATYSGPAEWHGTRQP